MTTQRLRSQAKAFVASTLRNVNGKAVSKATLKQTVEKVVKALEPTLQEVSANLGKK